MKGLLGVALLVVLAVVFGLTATKSQEEVRNDIIEDMEGNMTLESSAFDPNTTIPEQYTCDGDNINPPLTISGVPESAESLVLIMDDPDIPDVVKMSRGIEKFDHWVLVNIPSDTTEIPESVKGVGSPGLNTPGDLKYTGPCPPPEHEPTEHRYIFQLYALDTILKFESDPTEADVRTAMKGHILEKAELIGLYDRSK